MPTFNINLPNSKTALIEGIRPFSTKQYGSHTGAYDIIGGDGAHAQVVRGGESAPVIFAHAEDVNAVVTALNNSVASTAIPTITGTVKVGMVITANHSFTGNPAPTMSYRFLANDVQVQAGAAATYTLTATEQGKVMKVEVTAINVHTNGSITETSAPTAAVAV